MVKPGAAGWPMGVKVMASRAWVIARGSPEAS